MTPRAPLSPGSSGRRRRAHCASFLPRSAAGTRRPPSATCRARSAPAPIRVRRRSAARPAGDDRPANTPPATRSLPPAPNAALRYPGPDGPSPSIAERQHDQQHVECPDHEVLRGQQHDHGVEAPVLAAPPRTDRLLRPAAPRRRRSARRPASTPARLPTSSADAVTHNAKKPTAAPGPSSCDQQSCQRRAQRARRRSRPSPRAR